MKKLFLAVDPGTSKCGLAVMDTDGLVHEKLVAPLEGLTNTVQTLISVHTGVEVVAIGAGTGSKPVAKILKAVCTGTDVIYVQEKNTTLRARELYEKDHPRRWPASMLPFGLFGMPEDMDAYAAVAIGMIFIEMISEGKN